MVAASAMNPRQQEPIFKFAQADDGNPSEKMKQRSAKMLAKLQDFFQHPKLNMSDVKFSAPSCMHFTVKSYDEGGIALRRDKKEAVFLGTMTYAPSEIIEQMAGTSVLQYNKATNRVELYAGISIHSHFHEVGAPDPEEPALHLAPADGESMNVPEPIRTATKGRSMANHLAHKLITAIPPDYTYMSTSDTCTKEHLQQLEEYFNSAEFKVVQDALEKRKAPPAVIAMKLLGWMLDTGDCTKEYLRSNSASAYFPVSFNYYAAMQLFHLVSETPGHSIIPAVTQDWLSVYPKTILGRWQTGTQKAPLKVTSHSEQHEVTSASRTEHRKHATGAK